MSVLFLALLIAAAVEAAPASQSDFNGVWVLDATRSETFLSGGQIDRRPLVIIQTGASFTIAPAGAGEQDTSYAMILSPNHREVGPGGSAYWEGPALVSQIEGLINGKSVVLKQSRTLAPGGAEMVVDTTLAIQHGYAPGEPLPKSTTRDIYVRAPTATFDP